MNASELRASWDILVCMYCIHAVMYALNILQIIWRAIGCKEAKPRI